MNKAIFIQLIAGGLLTLSACHPSQSSQDYVIEGMVRDSSANGKTIYLMRYDDQANIDSTVVQDNRFTFKGQIDTAVFCRIDVTRHEYSNLILEGGHIQADLESHNAPEGTPMNEKYARISHLEDSLIQILDKTYQAYQKKCKDANEFSEQWEAFWKELEQDQSDKAKAFFRKHNNDALGYSLIYSFSFDLIPKPEQKELMLAAGPWMKSQQVVKQRLVEIEALEKTAEGKTFTDIKGIDLQGDSIALSDFIGKGNYVLMDIWASWCGPCKEEIPNLAKLHERFKDKGLAVIGLFTWDSKENLPKAMKKEKITWPQIIDENQQAMKLYGVNGIPHIILFSPDGTILKRNLRGENMIHTIDKIFDKK